MAFTNATRPAPSVHGNGPREVCHAGWLDDFLDTHSKAKTQARCQAEAAWAKLWRRPVEVVFVKRRRP